MTSKLPQPESLSYEDLLQENRVLRQENDSLRSQDPYTWSLLAETSLKLQIYSASIKAAVSSLLNYDIFWDHANEHEFLETIDSSVNQVSELMALLTLAFRAQANSLALNRDFHALQEILSVSQTRLAQRLPDQHLEISFPAEGKPVLVDYEYLTMALVMLYEVLNAREPGRKLRVEAREAEPGWQLDLIGLDANMIQIVEHMHRCKTQPATGDYLPPEKILRLHLVCEILHLHHISVEAIDLTGENPLLRLSVPELPLT